MQPLLERITWAEKPSKIILDNLAEVERTMPELWQLRGRIQPPQWHPEGDAWVHTLEVIDIMAGGGKCLNVWGALVHDLGKGITPEHELPHHYHHESLGVPLVRLFGTRLDVPEDWIRFGQLCAKEHLNVHRFLQLRPHKKADLLERLGDYAEGVANVAQADARGRGPDNWNKPYPSRDALLTAVDAIYGVTRETPQKTRDAKAAILKEIFK
jgi:tRNA nucleotidyltransferase (CCA-adding enzyme)